MNFLGLSNTVKVEQSDAAIVEDGDGQFVSVLYGGKHKLNKHHKVVGTVSRRLQEYTVRVDCASKESITSTYEIRFQAEVVHGSEQTAFYELREPQATMESLSADRMRQSIRSYTLAQVYQMREEIAHDVTRGLCEQLEGKGWRATHVIITEIIPPPEVVEEWKRKAEEKRKEVKM
uniref:Band 7 domain-containing protein n=1 Tax=Chromera velia CCMP2878 TaxID=1169474 RepID=A0A0G4HGT8_9ALVE|eukprot:Cvel_27358.t1-p1 / transcript=Cvel_27358.t1 / gene=Cvel_27358 / organism=Chromera_velia_CCMP2878 / gene_product=Hypersensitive-induced response protein 4, putative / transcript_product=Hypersensitive-induced response protein 4, putative / location=Cvel_scaffold3399:15172-15696(+) / protein_length=175 / sequence_SO=supercontig / SO=protein_coding / is_pseudo=false